MFPEISMNKEGGKSLQHVGGIKIAIDFRLDTNVNCRYLRISVREKYGAETSQKGRTETGKSMSLVPACPLLDGDGLAPILASDEGGFLKGGSNILFNH